MTLGKIVFMEKVYWPFVSIIIPTLNSDRTLDLCLSSISVQKYFGRMEIIIADGGSVDNTIQIVRNYKTKVIENKLRTGEAGKAAGAKLAKGEILAFIDSDNVLPEKSWLTKMIKPFLENPQIIASEPLYFIYRKKDHYLTRYFALLGMGDPLNLFIGNYDKYSFLSNKWTEMKVESSNNKGYILLLLKDQIPTIGANGFFIKKKALQAYPKGEYLFDIDVLRFLSRSKGINVAKVKVGIIHLFTGDILTFIRKQRRRISDYLYFKKSGIRAGEKNKNQIIWGVIKFIISTLLIFPLFIQVIIGYCRKKDKAWLFHPVACWLTLLFYGFEYIRSFIYIKPYERSRWKQ